MIIIVVVVILQP